MLNIKSAPKKRGEIKKSIPKDEFGFYKSFLDALENTSYNLDIFYKNVKNLDFVQVKNTMHRRGLQEYNMFYNMISYTNPDDLKNGTMHELFHASSTVVGSQRIYSGFSQTHIKSLKSVGVGLNEGCTYYLDEKYFKDYSPNKQKEIGKSCNLNKRFAFMLECIVGEEEFLRLYSTCNLKDLYDYLSYITSEEETNKFLTCMDIIYKETSEKIFPKYNTVIKAYDYCNRYLTSILLILNFSSYFEFLMNDDEYEDALFEIRDYYRKPLMVKNKVIYTPKESSDSEFQKMVDKLVIKNRDKSKELVNKRVR